MILSRNMLKRLSESRHPSLTIGVVQNQSPMHEENCATGLVIQVFDDSDKVGADIVFLQRCPQSCMPNPVEGLFGVYADKSQRRGLVGAENVSRKGFLG